MHEIGFEDNFSFMITVKNGWTFYKPPKTAFFRNLPVVSSLDGVESWYFRIESGLMSFTQYVFLFFKKVNILRLTGKKRWVHVVSLTELKYYFLASRLRENLINIQWNVSVEKRETIWTGNEGIFEAKFRLLKCISNQISFLKVIEKVY